MDSELRRDPVVGRWVIIAEERGKRPSDFWESLSPKQHAGFCPFCPGNERTTPPEIYALRDPQTPPDGPGWSLRVVPNKYPALRAEGSVEKSGVGLFDRMSGVGTHEVIIETPSHEMTLARMEVGAVEDVLWAYRERMLDLRKDPRFQYVLVFKNEGAAAGATLEHSHSQLVALPVVPKQVQEELQGSRTYYEWKHCCVYCDILRQENDEQARVVLENGYFVALAPFASCFPFEVWILPRQHQASYEDMAPALYAPLAVMLKEILARMDQVLHVPPYNFVLHTAPLRRPVRDTYHWHLEITPKLIRHAGFEWGSGFYINPTPPEEAARLLREASS